MEEHNNSGKKWIIAIITVCLFCWKSTQVVLFFIFNIFLIFITMPLRMMDRMDQYITRQEYRELLSYMDWELPDDLKLSQVDVDHEQRSFCCEYEIGAGYETVRAHLEEYLFMKELAERALLDVGSVPEDYKIRIVLQGCTPPDRIIFCNMVDEDTAQKAQGEVSGGCHLISAEICLPCDLSSLSVLKDVEYLILNNTTIDDLSGLENMDDLIYLCYISSWEDGRNDFTEEQLLSIEQMYPKCYIRGYSEEDEI